MPNLHETRDKVIKTLKNELGVNAPIQIDPGGEGGRDFFSAAQQTILLRLLKQVENHVNGVTVSSDEIMYADERLTTTLQNIGVDTGGRSITDLVDKALVQVQRSAIEAPKQAGANLLDRGPQRFAPKGDDLVAR